MLTQSFDATFVWCMQSKLINLIPECKTCVQPLKLCLAKVTENFDSRWYKCTKCKIKESIRFGSYTAEFKCTLMELIRIIFYYYCRGYTVDVVFRELSFYNLGSKGGLRLAKQMVLGIYAFIREIVSDRVIRDLRKHKLGGPGQEVWLDTYKLNLRTNSGVDEFWIVGFIEKETNRARAYLTGDIKIDTIALFIAKTV